ncbi:SDR family oxidoreductase [Acidiferrimicrobium sp. IK]|uniref:SDR family NAD(P)-dependent oxidoreductase n=1 Tax=Acidiferrimicrobium sp. IK TaxID=2871700 RepID=UPI0021CB057F|nr:SDR family NAD(P)-dependent oxidoreductase [Acidiferrimicrobium sp. IK]MCU4183493.1 SDR family oxidoreductase [Acidiferrimicrobium sp. IK]
MTGWFEQRGGLEGTVALVTGGAGGLGEAIVTDLADNGVRVALIDRDEAAVASIERSLSAAGAHHVAVVGDARDPDQLAALFGRVDDEWGRLDTLVNVVGGTFKAPFAGSTPKAWDALLRTNLMHVLHASSLAIPRMRVGGRGGSIVNVTTIEAHRGAPNFAVYSAAKAAVAQFARTLAVELAPDAIRVNCVAPDLAPTPNMEKISGGRPIGSSPMGVRIAVPMGRLGTPQDISSSVVFLASGLSSYMTGITLHPDGGTFAASGWFNWPEDGYLNAVPVGVLDAMDTTGGDAV